MNKLVEYIDVAVIGAGHAGCEASLAAARLGLETMVFTVSVDSIAMMPCNPNIGGSSKGHLVKEIDALGGEMGKVIDKTFIQSKMLNKSKGPAVQSLAAHACPGRQEKLQQYHASGTGEYTTSDDQTGGSDGTDCRRWYDQGSKNIFRRNVLCKGSCSVYRNVSEGEMHLWRCK